MRNTLLIALREFAENAKTKGFWIGLFMFPFLIALAIGVTGFLARAEPARYFVVVDPSDTLAGPIDQSLARAPQRRFVRVELPIGIDAGGSSRELLAALKPYLVGERRITVDGKQALLFAALLVQPGALDPATRDERRAAAGEPAIQYWSTNLTVDNLPNLIRDTLNRDVRQRLYRARGVDATTVNEIEATSVRLGTFDPGKAAGEETVSSADRIIRYAPLAFVYLLWISIFSIMQMLLNNTIEEKSNRIAEVLLSSVTPHEIMMGKLLGIAVIGLTMVGVWLASAVAGLQLYQGPGADGFRQVLDAVTTSGLVPTFLLCFMLGYLIYAGLFLSVGALCNDIKDAQNLQGVMMLIMFVPFLTMTAINRDPHGALATVMTWIPLYTPFTLMNRAAADPPLAELIGATLLMVATAMLLLWSAGRIFRMGLLHGGNRPKLAEIVRWVRGHAA